jgi:hypothetical protein
MGKDSISNKRLGERKESMINAIFDDYLRPNTYVSKHVIWQRMRKAFHRMTHEELNSLWILLTCVRKKKTKKVPKKVLHVFKVQQRESAMVYLNFPLDMLRRDECHPSTSEDAGNIAFSFHLDRKKGYVGEISLVTFQKTNWEPNKDRWESFGWEVSKHGRLE